LNSASLDGERQRVTPATYFDSLSIAMIESPHSMALLAKGTPKTLNSSNAKPTSLDKYS
jgi:hypothetical protein